MEINIYVMKDYVYLMIVNAFQNPVMMMNVKDVMMATT